MRTAEEISLILRNWPREFRPQTRDVVRDALLLCCALYGCKSAVMAWEEGEEPWLIIGRLSGDSFECVETVVDEYTPLVCSSVESLSFYQAVGGAAIASDGRRFDPDPELIHADFRRVYSVRAVISLPVRGDTISGRVFLLDPEHHSQELLLIGDVLGLLLATQFDCSSRAESEKRTAVAEERMRVARDLHDGLLQSFTGVVLQLETVHDILTEHPEKAHTMLTEVQANIMSDQRELRAYVEHLGPRRRTEMKFDFRERLEEWRERFEKQWSVKVSFDGEHVDPLVAAFLGQETLRLIQEAVTNSAKHGSASEATVILTTGDGRMCIEVADNGSGFPFHGRRTLEEIRNGAGGPFVLAQRVAALNGDMNVDSGENGARIEISIPLGWSGN
jgi:signal transduction histidine kinase